MPCRSRSRPSGWLSPAQAADDLGIQCGGWTIAWQGKTGQVTHGGTTILWPRSARLWVRTPSHPLRRRLGRRGGRCGCRGDRRAALCRDVGRPQGAEPSGRGPGCPQEGQGVRRSGRDHRPFRPARPAWPVLDSSDAVIAAWLPGTEGQGVADVLFGDFKPAGKLPHTWPRSMDQVPCNVGDDSAKDPLFPYGFGLTY